MSSKSRLNKVLSILGIVGLVVYGFFVAQMILVFSLQAFVELGWLSSQSLDSATVEFNITFLAYALALVIILGLYAAIKNTKINILEILALNKKPSLMILLHICLGYGVYFLLSVVFGLLSDLLLPWFDPNQAQDVGFTDLSGWLDFVAVFLALVVLAPLVEEMIFRGFMYSRIRKNASFIVTSLVVSLTFGLVHLQWNVGVDVFALSLVLCYLREKTDSVWAGVGVHMLKNMLAYAIIFLNIDIEKIIMQLFSW